MSKLVGPKTIFSQPFFTIVISLNKVSNGESDVNFFFYGFHSEIISIRVKDQKLRLFYWTTLFPVIWRPAVDLIYYFRAWYARDTWPRVQLDQSDWSLSRPDWVYIHHLTWMVEFQLVQVDRYNTSIARRWTKIRVSSKTAHISICTRSNL